MKTFSITTIALAALISAAPAAQALPLDGTMNFDAPGSNMSVVGGSQNCAPASINGGMVCGTPNLTLQHTSGVTVTASATASGGGVGTVDQDFTPLAGSTAGLGVFSVAVPVALPGLDLADDSINKKGETLKLHFDTGALDITEVVFSKDSYSNNSFGVGDFLEYNAGAGWVNFMLGSGPLSFAPHSLITDEISFRYGNADFYVTSITAVPEPGTYALMFAGLAALGFVARRRRPV